MSPTTISIGKEIRATCSSCKKPQHHIITAISGTKIDQVQCKSCGKSHKYRAPEIAGAAPKRRRKGAVEVVPPEVTWEKLMTASAAKKTIAYTFDKQYRVNDRLSHDTFGLGVVTNLPGPDKARIAFKDGERLLICNR